MIRDMEWALKNLQMEIFMKVNIRMERFMVKENIHGRMENSMMDNGLMVKNKGTALGKIMKMNNLVDSGMEISQMDLENMAGVMEMFMKVSGRHV